MIAVFGCETARELLESFLDNELPTAQQVAVQAHLRSCRTCSARIEDMSLIGWSLRTGPSGSSDHVEQQQDAKDLAIMQSGVLARVRAERAESFRMRLADWGSDMRLIWPAIGATAAVLLCLVGAGNVWRLTTEKNANSFAAMLETAENPGSDRNPLRLEDARSAPRVLHDGQAFDEQSEGDRMVAFAVVVTQGGQIGDVEALDLPTVVSSDGSSLLSFDDGHDVAHNIRSWQLTPAQSRSGRPVAVRVVYLFAQTTAVKESVRALTTPRPRPAEHVKDPAVPIGTRSSIDGGSTAA